MISPILSNIPVRSYDIALEQLGTACIKYAWPQSIDDELAKAIIALMRATTQTTPIIGFSNVINDGQAQLYIEELRTNLTAGKCHLLAVLANDGSLIGKCILRRNLNPNNRHIVDLAKGMIAERFRGGGLVLAAAFIEITRLCQAENIELVTLDVRAGTRAHRVWERFGFRTYGILEDYARCDGQSIAGHFMSQPVAELRSIAYQIATRAGIEVKDETSA